MTRGRVLFIDHEVELCRAAQEWLGVSGFSVTTSSNPETAIAQTDPDTLDCVVSDVRMPGLTGIEVLDHFRAAAPELPVILLTGHGDIPLAVEAMRAGAHDFLEKPYDAELLVAVLDRAVERRRLGLELTRLRQAAGSSELDDHLVGLSAPMAALIVVGLPPGRLRCLGWRGAPSTRRSPVMACAPMSTLEVAASRYPLPMPPGPSADGPM